MPVLPAVPSTIVPPGAQRAARFGVANDIQRGAVFDRLSGVHKLGFAEYVAAGFRRRFFELDQWGIADGLNHAIVKVHVSCVLLL
jgi:hypothetical protein